MSFDPENFLNSLEPIGWKLGLDRINALCDELDRPQDSFDTIHVVGTNGKSSVARMTAAILTAHGMSAGCLVSPHLSAWSERVLINGAYPDAAAFAEVVSSTALAAEAVNSRLEPGDVVTQFEVAVAAGFLLLARAGVGVAAIEAGLGGRLDATNTIASEVTVLTSIGLEHTEWLGESEVEIAAEKLAVLRQDTVLVLGPVSPEVRELARTTATERRCLVVEPGDGLPSGVSLESPALYQRGNFAMAAAAAQHYLERPGSAGRHDSGPGGPAPQPISKAELQRAAGAAFVPGRLEQVDDSPPAFIDVAHNRPAAAALAASVPGLAQGRPVIGVVGILDDKDATGIIEELAPVLDFAVFTGLPAESLANSARPGARGLEPEVLRRIAHGSGLEAEAVPLPGEALARAGDLAVRRGGIVLVAGSHYLWPRQ